MGKVANLRCHLVMSRNVGGGTVCMYGEWSSLLPDTPGENWGEEKRNAGGGSWQPEKEREREEWGEPEQMRSQEYRGESLQLPSLTQLMAARRQRVCSVFAPHALVPLCFYVPSFFFIPLQLGQCDQTHPWGHTPHTQQQHTQFSLYSQRGNFVAQISSLGSLVEP